MATVFERTPSVEQLGEEALRDMLLGMLNTNYRGDVAGELFNGSGKTDILVRVEDKNVFIGECKFYGARQTVTRAVDQPLSYLVWRDTGAALLMFVRGGNFTQAVERIHDAVEAHPQCQARRNAGDPARRVNYDFVRADDPTRRIRLAVMPFHIREGSRSTDRAGDDPRRPRLSWSAGQASSRLRASSAPCAASTSTAASGWPQANATTTAATNTFPGSSTPVRSRRAFTVSPPSPERAATLLRRG